MIDNLSEFYKKCKICGETFETPRTFTLHLRKHEVELKDYLIEHIFDGQHPKCMCKEDCDKLVGFRQESKYLNRAYFYDYARNHSPREPLSEESKQKAKENQKQTWLKKYGVEHISKSKEVNEKKAETMKTKPNYVPKESVVKQDSERFINEPHLCEVCNKTLSNSGEFVRHLKKEHNLSKKDYYLNVKLKGIAPLCLCGCGQPTLFSDKRELRDNNYFQYYLNHHRERQPDKPEVAKLKYENMKATLLSKHGVENAMFIPTSSDKIKQTKLEKYGDSNYVNIEKQIQTKKSLYNIKTKEEKELAKEQLRQQKSFQKSILRHIAKVEKDAIKNEKLLNKIANLKPKQEPKIIVDNSVHICKICNQENTVHGIRTHLAHKHPEWNIRKYTETFGEFRPHVIELNQKLENSNLSCKICNQKMLSEFMLSKHVKRNHNITKKDYILKYIFNDIHPTCKCENNCGQKVAILEHGKNNKGENVYCRDYVQGHIPPPVWDGSLLTDESRAKMSRSAILRGSNQKKRDTKGELAFKNFCERLNIPYISQYPQEFGLIDFYLPEQNLLVEIDGSYYHPMKKENLNKDQLTGAIGDKRKFGKVDYRILDLDVPKLESLKDLEKYNRVVEQTIPHNQVIMSRDYFINHKNSPLSGDSFLKDMVSTIIRLLKIYEPEFPYPTSNNSIVDIALTINNYDMSKVYDRQDKVFKNNAYPVGVTYLKSIFKSYFHSKYKGHKLTAYQMYQDNETLRKIVEYRIGLNESGEVFDLSYKQILKGISAIRGTISFFKPLVAGAIYKEFISNKQKPIVLDPCCGFGGRLLGFKSIYPNGTYIGCEPNIDTYNELIELSKNFNNVKIFNCRFEDFDGSIFENKFDLVFTSIPYYDLETYSNQQIYYNIEHWKDTFISSLLKYDNLLLNIPKDLEYLFADKKYETFYLRNNVAKHLSKNGKTKDELILKFR